MKRFFKNDYGDFVLAEQGEVVKALKNMKKRKLWRCTVCNDLYVGEVPPKQCPTCMAIEAYVEINEKEFNERIKP
jgi:hypothetical protein